MGVLLGIPFNRSQVNIAGQKVIANTENFYKAALLIAYGVKRHI